MGGQGHGKYFMAVQGRVAQVDGVADEVHLVGVQKALDFALILHQVGAGLEGQGDSLGMGKDGDWWPGMMGSMPAPPHA